MSTISSMFSNSGYGALSATAEYSVAKDLAPLPTTTNFQPVSSDLYGGGNANFSLTPQSNLGFSNLSYGSTGAGGQVGPNGTGAGHQFEGILATNPASTPALTTAALQPVALATLTSYKPVNTANPSGLGGAINTVPNATTDANTKSTTGSIFSSTPLNDLNGSLGLSNASTTPSMFGAPSFLIADGLLPDWVPFSKQINSGTDQLIKGTQKNADWVIEGTQKNADWVIEGTQSNFGKAADKVKDLYDWGVEKKDQLIDLGIGAPGRLRRSVEGGLDAAGQQLQDLSNRYGPSVLNAVDRALPPSSPPLFGSDRWRAQHPQQTNPGTINQVTVKASDLLRSGFPAGQLQNLVGPAIKIDYDAVPSQYTPMNGDQRPRQLLLTPDGKTVLSVDGQLANLSLQQLKDNRGFVVPPDVATLTLPNSTTGKVGKVQIYYEPNSGKKPLGIQTAQGFYRAPTQADLDRLLGQQAIRKAAYPADSAKLTTPYGVLNIYPNPDRTVNFYQEPSVFGGKLIKAPANMSIADLKNSFVPTQSKTAPPNVVLPSAPLTSNTIVDPTTKGFVPVRGAPPELKLYNPPGAPNTMLAFGNLNNIEYKTVKMGRATSANPNPTFPKYTGDTWIRWAQQGLLKDQGINPQDLLAYSNNEFFDNTSRDTPTAKNSFASYSPYTGYVTGSQEPAGPKLKLSVDNDSRTASITPWPLNYTTAPISSLKPQESLTDVMKLMRPTGYSLVGFSPTFDPDGQGGGSRNYGVVGVDKQGQNYVGMLVGDDPRDRQWYQGTAASVGFNSIQFDSGRSTYGGWFDKSGNVRPVAHSDTDRAVTSFTFLLRKPQN
jgi:hypothetical protein